MEWYLHNSLCYLIVRGVVKWGSRQGTGVKPRQCLSTLVPVSQCCRASFASSREERYRGVQFRRRETLDGTDGTERERESSTHGV